MTTRKLIPITVLVITAASAIPQKPGDILGLGEATYIGAAYEVRTKKYGFGLADPQGKWIKPAFTGLEMTPIKFDFFDNDDPTTNFLDFKWKGIGLLEGGKFQSANIRDVLSAFQSTDKSYSLGVGLHTLIYQDDKNGFHPSLQAYGEYTTSRDAAGVNTNKGRFAMELRLSTATQSKKDEAKDFTTFLPGTNKRFGTKSVPAFKASLDVVRIAKARVQAAERQSLATLEVMPRDASDATRNEMTRQREAIQARQLERTAAFRSAFVTDERAQGASRLTDVESNDVLLTAVLINGLSETPQRETFQPALGILTAEEMAVLKQNAELASELSEPLEDAFRAVAAAEVALSASTAESNRERATLIRTDNEFIKKAISVLEDVEALNEAAITARRQNLKVSHLRYLAGKLGESNEEPKLSFALQAYGWVSENERARGYLSANLLYAFGKPAANSSFSPGLGISVLVGDLPTGITAKPKIQIQLAIPLK